MYSSTHNKSLDNDMIHNNNALWLILQKGMCLIHHQNLLHSGDKSRLKPNNENLIVLRLLSYFWTETKEWLPYTQY